MKPGSDKILARAERALARAAEHLRAGATDRALERAYHAIVYAARVILSEEGEAVRSHHLIRERLSTVAPRRHRPIHLAVAEALRRRAARDAPTADEAIEFVAVARAAVAEAGLRLSLSWAEQAQPDGEIDDRPHRRDSDE